MELRPDSLVSQANLMRGMAYWHGKKNWPRDFHRQFYRDMATLRAEGITEQWWRGILPHLRGWRATRPLPNETIFRRGLDRLSALEREYNALSEYVGPSASDFTTLQWKDVEDLYIVAHSIKGVQRPVFGSKLCHFMIPGMFPVIDGDAVGIRSDNYSAYWRYCQEAWKTCKEKEQLVAQLSEAITGAGEAQPPQYPWGTKITEICLIGQRAATLT